MVGNCCLTWLIISHMTRPISLCVCSVPHADNAQNGRSRRQCCCKNALATGRIIPERWQGLHIGRRKESRGDRRWWLVLTGVAGDVSVAGIHIDPGPDLFRVMCLKAGAGLPGLGRRLTGLSAGVWPGRVQSRGTEVAASLASRDGAPSDAITADDACPTLRPKESWQPDHCPRK